MNDCSCSVPPQGRYGRRAVGASSEDAGEMFAGGGSAALER